MGNSAESTVEKQMQRDQSWFTWNAKKEVVYLAKEIGSSVYDSSLIVWVGSQSPAASGLRLMVRARSRQKKYRSKDKFKDAWGGSPQMKCIGQVLKFGKKIQAFISQIMTRQIQIESEEFFVAAPLISRLWPFPCRLACPSLPCLPCSCPLPHSSTLFHTLLCHTLTSYLAGHHLPLGHSPTSHQPSLPALYHHQLLSGQLIDNQLFLN